jgi:hypothetical protein
VAQQPLTRYPVQLDVTHPESQSRWKALFRLALSIPLLIIAYPLINFAQAGTVLAMWMAVLVRGRIPRWLFDFDVATTRFALRSAGYLFLLTDQYPPFEGDHAVRYDVEYREHVSRWRLVIWKFLTAIPHLIVLYLLWLAVLVAVIVAWLSVLATGRYPRVLHDFVAGVLLWGARVRAYMLSLTDEFPPFSMAPDAGPGGAAAYRIASAIAVLAAIAFVGAITAVLVIGAKESQHIEAQVSYERLLAGSLDLGEGRAHVHSGQIDLVAAVDPANDRYAFFTSAAGTRLVEFQFEMQNERGRGDNPIRTSRFTLVDTSGDEHDALIATLDGDDLAPANIDPGDSGVVTVLCDLPTAVDPAELQYDVLEYGGPFGEQIDWHFE